MKRVICIAVIVGSLSGVLSASNFALGISGSDQGINGFSLSIGNYFGVAPQEVRDVEYYVPREQMSVVYFLANESHRDARYITDLRRGGLSWWNISMRLGLDPYILYRAQNSRYKRHHMRDAEIADYVNVRFLSDYHHVSRDEIIRRRHEGERYERINDYYRGRQDNPQYHEQRNSERHDKDSRGDKKSRDNRDKGHGNSYNR